MENLNAERIKSDLERCKFGKDKPNCEGCNYKPWIKPRCWHLLCCDALALINSQEQDKEKLGLLIDELEKEKRELFEENKRLTEENERLKATRYMLHSDGRLERIPSVESSKVKLERITVIVREHLDDDPFEKAIAEANGVKPKGSTVGVKISFGGEQYGTYACFKQSTLSASEVAECINGQFETLLKGLEKTE